MKYLKNYKLFESKKEIESICQEYGIQDYIIQYDGTVDVDGNVNLRRMGLTKLPLKFGKVSGDFNCASNGLTSLEGCPKEVGRDFLCQHNRLTTLKGSPTSVGMSFICSNNQLTTLEGCPKTVGCNFDCTYNQLVSLNGSPKEVGVGFYCSNNQLTSLEGSPKQVLNFECKFNELTSLEGCPSVENLFVFNNNQIITIGYELKFVKELHIHENPIFEVYKIFNSSKKFKESLDCGYFTRPGEPLIDRLRFEEACEEQGIDPPTKIKGYEFI